MEQQLQVQTAAAAAVTYSNGIAVAFADSNASITRVNALMKLLLLPDITSLPCVVILM